MFSLLGERGCINDFQQQSLKVWVWGWCGQIEPSEPAQLSPIAACVSCDAELCGRVLGAHKEAALFMGMYHFYSHVLFFLYVCRMTWKSKSGCVLGAKGKETLTIERLLREQQLLLATKWAAGAVHVGVCFFTSLMLHNSSTGSPALSEVQRSSTTPWPLLLSFSGLFKSLSRLKSTRDTNRVVQTVVDSAGDENSELFCYSFHI